MLHTIKIQKRDVGIRYPPDLAEHHRVYRMLLEKKQEPVLVEVRRKHDRELAQAISDLRGVWIESRRGKDVGRRQEDAGVLHNPIVG